MKAGVRRDYRHSSGLGALRSLFAQVFRSAMLGWESRQIAKEVIPTEDAGLTWIKGLEWGRSDLVRIWA
jgi:hypothetical protein